MYATAKHASTHAPLPPPLPGVGYPPLLSITATRGNSKIAAHMRYAVLGLRCALCGLVNSQASFLHQISVTLRMCDDTLVHALATKDEVQHVEVLAPEDVAVHAILAAVAMHDRCRRERQRKYVGTEAREPPGRGLVLQHR